ncbi:MAG: hypothetical protein NQU42_03715 [Methanothrix sp.]|uniref:hypothetical protein n=1 Tax=Methanothrix sp. TaxID=90426 RepID=UPI0025FE4A51|nr:hypothetical protein [Methanothrix sp.]MCQ8903188.1 hypothetical protein [Methanothrix sp.]
MSRLPPVNKAIVFLGPEDCYGPCGCGMDMAILPVLVPKDWYLEECPPEVANDFFCMGEDFRRICGFTINNVFEYEMNGVEYFANFSCCRECAERAVNQGYAVWADRDYPMSLR